MSRVPAPKRSPALLRRAARGLWPALIILILLWASPPLPAADPDLPAPMEDTDFLKSRVKIEVLPICPPVLSPPQVKRKSIIVRGGHFGEGVMEFFSPIMILHLHGSSREMGYQHGAMLRDVIRKRLMEIKALHDPTRVRADRGERGFGRRIGFFTPIYLEKAHFLVRFGVDWPEWAREELKGIAEGSGISLFDLIWLNMTKPTPEGIPGPESAPSGSGEAAPSPGPSPIASILLGQEPDLPEWMVIVFHPEGAPKYAAVARPGAVGILGGLSEQGCYIETPGTRAPAGLSVREAAGRGGATGPGTGRPDRCEFTFPAGAHEVKIILDSPGGLICIHQSPHPGYGAVDLATESWHERCGLCGEATNDYSR